MNAKSVCILDYGCGNVRSVNNIFAAIADEVIVSNDIHAIRSSSHVVLPGVGAFGASMKRIKEKIPLEALEAEIIKNGKPFLGICVGMQILAEKGHEFGEHEGLGWVSGETVKLNAGNLPLPHIGWNSINIKVRSSLLKEFKDNEDFYFVHSYVFRGETQENTVAVTRYGEDFPSIIQKGNIFGVQFHPEKSQKAGRALLKNFLDIS